MKKHPNKKRVLRRIANALNWHYFGVAMIGNKLSPNELHFHSRLIRSYMREDENGRYF
jgi:hypothetical protein